MLIVALLFSLAGAPAPLAVVTVGNVAVAQVDGGHGSPGDLTPTLDDAPGLINNLAQAVREKNWQLVVAMAVMLLVILVNFVLLKLNILPEEIRKLALPWISVGTGCLVTFAGALLAGASWFSAILTGFVTGAAAIGLWELVFKHLGQLGAKKPSP